MKPYPCYTVNNRRMNETTTRDATQADRWAVTSYAEIGKRLGISKGRVRQLEQRALRKLRAALSVKSGALRSIMEEKSDW